MVTQFASRLLDLEPRIWYWISMGDTLTSLNWAFASAPKHSNPVNYASGTITSPGEKLLTGLGGLYDVWTVEFPFTSLPTDHNTPVWLTLHGGTPNIVGWWVPSPCTCICPS